VRAHRKLKIFSKKLLTKHKHPVNIKESLQETVDEGVKLINDFKAILEWWKPDKCQSQQMGL